MARETVKFTDDPWAKKIIWKIGERAWNDLQGARHYDKFTKLDVVMDVSATHANGNPLRLQALLEADDPNFAHDILGIRRHLNRETGRLEGDFRPRFSHRATENAERGV